MAATHVPADYESSSQANAKGNLTVEGHVKSLLTRIKERDQIVEA